MPNTAIRNARRQSVRGPAFDVGYCLREVRELYGIGPEAPDAFGAWEAAEHKHRTTDPKAIPRGVPVFWSGGSEGHGHIAVSTGFGRVWTPDTLRPGYFDKTTIERVTSWVGGGRLLGWTEDLNGVRVYNREWKDD